MSNYIPLTVEKNSLGQLLYDDEANLAPGDYIGKDGNTYNSDHWQVDDNDEFVLDDDGNQIPDPDAPAGAGTVNNYYGSDPSANNDNSGNDNSGDSGSSGSGDSGGGSNGGGGQPYTPNPYPPYSLPPVIAPPNTPPILPPAIRLGFGAGYGGYAGIKANPALQAAPIFRVSSTKAGSFAGTKAVKVVVNNNTMQRR